MNAQRVCRVLGLDVRSRYTGYVCIESRNALVDFGLTTYTSPVRAEVRINSIVQKLHPTVLVLRELTPESRRYHPKTLILRNVARLAARRTQTRVGVILESQLNAFFALHDARNKQEVAVRIAERYPDLVWHLPRPRKAWEPQQRYMPLFDAAALALTFIELSKRGELFAGLPTV